MILLGLTGSIGMGKSETAKLFAGFGIPVYDADRAVHDLYAQNGDAVGPIAEIFPDAIKDGAVDRARLGKLVLNDPAAMTRLEAVIHPLVAKVQAAFLAKARADGHPLVVLDIPLLFETGGKSRVDKIAVVSTTAEIQHRRVLMREGMTEEKFAAILGRQMPDSQKRALADFVIDTSHGIDDAKLQVRRVIDQLLSEAEHA